MGHFLLTREVPGDCHRGLPQIGHEVDAVLCVSWVDASHVAPITILADAGELRSGIPGALRELGADVVVGALTAGDYRIPSGTLVERKTVADLHRSVTTGRLWAQLEKLRRSANRAWLLVEGPKLDAGQPSEQGIRGALIAVIETGIPVLWSGSTGDSARWLLRLAARTRGSHAPGVWIMRAPRRRQATAPVRLLCQVRGISPQVAARLLDRFGSIAAIARASEGELMTIEGVGRVRAETLVATLSGASRFSEKRPVTRSVVERAAPGGAVAACSGRAVPRHLGGSP
jgi:DNA excision repair protein ERCC-4